ncbi:PelOta protein homologue, putative [Plasmodium knowlesi strain H]|uniref:Protein pelota homolog n=3 Tax=Plasmodium knowlesi TaxID=5850 RepID=A0A5K1VFZ0_PLAKH|nr:PelOta-like protein [Plasmodium knowlesi strain H]OTN68593.1 Protein pelota-like protein [Plasmodium knowlesi]CAA9986600.1 protein pelota homolog, putative [Plasmodium knowlesi strain H]SBO24125.1 PelOta protein homologue, putative [Plasmodium knowlesi strain H]SBO29311.1 PelOta protein homologue, putative [Plasmodium knowlesi strain H]VVS76074.1 protein pelota homolog, putative [Plasmodium knowlesi strain H]|eukprot:XP_002261140.1 PelOta-like protein [Plasmodium knowlesi strain H]
MKLLFRKRDNEDMAFGLVAEEDDDLWHLYNLISVNDEVETITSRKVHKDIGNNTYATEIRKMRLTLMITKVDFDSANSSLRLSGKNIKTNDYVKMGQYHTFEIALNEKIKIKKKNWDSVYKEKLEECTNVKMNSKVAILLVNCGEAQMYLLTENLCKHIFTLSKVIKKKREKSNNSLYAKSLGAFFQQLLLQLMKNVDVEKMQCIVLGGPGFFKNDFLQYVYEKSEQKNDKNVLSIKSKFLIVKTSSINRNSVNEILNNQQIKDQVLNMKVVSHIDVLNKFYKMFDKSEEKICYGNADVKYAASLQAIESLLITDRTFRNCDVVTRKEYVAMVRDVRNSGGRVYIFPDNHTTGEQLNALTGIAAILKFPVYMPEGDDERRQNEKREDEEN